jgi:hypothetical protein
VNERTKDMNVNSSPNAMRVYEVIKAWTEHHVDDFTKQPTYDLFIDRSGFAVYVKDTAYIVVRGSDDYDGALDIAAYEDVKAYVQNRAAVVPIVTEFTVADAILHLVAFINEVAR